MLFHLEYLALVAYIESVIPLLYAVYLTILYQLPSAKYYPHSQSLTAEKLRSTIGSIVVYASVEIVTLVLLHVLLKHRFGFSLMYQLAFVLENEMEQLQGRLFVWIIGLLQLTLVHYGKVAVVVQYKSPTNTSFFQEWISRLRLPGCIRIRQARA
jgi:hypothetical protein